MVVTPFNLFMMLPAELVEKVLFYADGCLLWKARRVCKMWKEIADFLIMKRDQMALCCRREMEPATLAELSALEPKSTAVYRLWDRHRRLAGWPATTLPPLDLAAGSARLQTRALAACCVAGESLVLAAAGLPVCAVPLSGGVQYEVPGCADRFPVSQLAVSRPAGGSPRRRLLTLVHENSLVRVTAAWLGGSSAAVLSAVQLRTRTGSGLTVSASGDLVGVCYRWEAWLYRAAVGEDALTTSTVCVVDLRSADGPWAGARCCPGGLVFLTVRAGQMTWCDSAEVSADSLHGMLPYSVLSLSPQFLPPPADALPPTASIDHPLETVLDFNAVSLVGSLGSELVLGHVERGCRAVDAFSALGSRVTACVLHGRLLLLGTETGSLAVYFIPAPRQLPDVDLGSPAALLKLADAPLRRLYVLEEQETVRVLADAGAGRLHACVWGRPGRAAALRRDPASLLQRLVQPEVEQDGGRERGNVERDGWSEEGRKAEK